MPSILVIEQEPQSVERISAALGAEGWRVRVVPSVDQALQTAAAEPPDLVMASTDVAGFEVLTFSFSRRGGGPGVVALDPGNGGSAAAAADARLSKPFTDQQVVLTARQALLARRPGTPQQPVAPAQKLTAQDIFGDVLAEVEGDMPPRPVIAPPRVPTAPPEPARPAPAAGPAGGEDVQRRLEKTLSGMLGAEPRPKPAAPPPPAAPPGAVPPPRRPDAAADNVDALLSRTLSNLELGKTKTGVRATGPVPIPPRPATPPPAVPAPPPVASMPPPPAPPLASAPAPPRAAEATGVRRARPAGDFDLAELEELARPTRPGTQTGARPIVPPPTPPPPAPPPPPVSAAPPRMAPAPEPARPAGLPEPPPPPPIPAGLSVAADPAAAGAAENPMATQRIPMFADEPGDQPGERFGQYTLLERIAVGGMAEVWKARMRGVEGFQKTVAIKRILPQMTGNAELMGMFIDEAKLAAQLTHPNIVHIYDLGKMGRDYYIAMELVDGKDLRSLLNAARHKGMPVPLGLGLLIAARVASALDYAHRKRDFEGRELGLVHRDVSPQNVLLTYEGDVKLCDFGIAKAVSKAGQTQIGALKGKLQYMSPEQAWGRPVDARSDLFSLGAVLFEMVTGERQFTGESEISVLEAVRQGRTRLPRQLDPAIPREVDEIVARALAIDPKDRFQSAGEMKQRLEAALASLSPSTGQTDLALFIQRALAPEPEGPEPAAAPPAVSSWPPVAAVEPPAAVTAPSSYPPDPQPPVEAVAPLGGVVLAEEEGGRKSRTLLYVAIVALIVIAILTFFFLNRRKGAPPPPPTTGATSAAAPAATPAAGPPTAQVPAALPAVQGAAGTPPPPVDIKAIVDQQVAARQAELQKQQEERVKQLEKQLAASKAAGQPPPAAPAPAPAAAVSEQAPPRPAPAEAAPQPPPPAPEPARKEPEPAKPQEKAALPEPAKREPEPEAPRTKIGELVDGGPGVSPPQLVSFPKPGYPPMARTLRVEGTVVVSVLVDENGQVQDVRMAEPIKQNVGLNEAALSAARSARYKPATKDGVRVKMWTRLKIPFKL
jgi:TonB family protein